MRVNKLFLAGILSSATLVACAPGSNTQNEIQNTGDGIIGGWEAQAGEPVTTSIVAVYDATEGQLCTGSLLPNNLVLTAAHCVGQEAESMYIFFDTKLSQSSKRLRVDKVEISPYWESNQRNDKNTGDIALLHFQGVAPSDFKPAKFLNANQRRFLAKGTEVVLAGYGITNGVTGDGAGTLRVTKVRIEDPNFSASEIKLNQTKGTGACHGDSGGPAYVIISGQYYLWGVTSRGVDDQNNDCSQYSAYTNALYYKSWINRASTKLSRSLVSPVISN